MKAEFQASAALPGGLLASRAEAQTPTPLNPAAAGGFAQTLAMLPTEAAQALVSAPAAPAQEAPQLADLAADAVSVLSEWLSLGSVAEGGAAASAETPAEAPAETLAPSALAALGLLPLSAVSPEPVPAPVSVSEQGFIAQPLWGLPVQPSGAGLAGLAWPQELAAPPAVEPRLHAAPVQASAGPDTPLTLSALPQPGFQQLQAHLLAQARISAALGQDGAGMTEEAVPAAVASPEAQPLPERLVAGSEGLLLKPLLRESAGPAQAGDGAPSPLALKGEPRQWQQPLLQALGDRLQLQIAGRSEQAVIRLDPPLLGQIEIAIRQQAGELQVRMNASHGEVSRQLQQISEGLRQDLVQRHSGEVTVLVSPGPRAADEARQAGREALAQQPQQQAQDQRQQPGRQQQEQQQEQAGRPGRGLSEEGGREPAFAQALRGHDSQL